MFFVARRVVTGGGAGRRSSSLYSAQNILSEENVQRTIDKFASITPFRLQTHRPARKAAVLIPVCVVDDKVCLLYTVRAARMRQHRGQVSFPGGMRDSGDRSLVDTALREAGEELGLAEGEVSVWGQGEGGPEVARGDTCVLPVVGRVLRPLGADLASHLRINPDEVEEAFAVPVQDLCHPEHIGHTQFRGIYSAPVYKGGKVRIWGLTAVITNLFLRCLLPPRAYHHPIKYIPTVTTGKPILPPMS